MCSFVLRGLSCQLRQSASSNGQSAWWPQTVLANGFLGFSEIVCYLSQLAVCAIQSRLLGKPGR